MNEEAKKKFTFKVVCLYIEDTYLFQHDYDQDKRIQHLNQIRQSVEYSGFKFYYSLFENVIFFLNFIFLLKINSVFRRKRGKTF